MRLSEFTNKKTYIWGVPGVEGNAMLEFMGSHNIPVGVIQNDIVPNDAEIVIKVPGVSVYKPEYLSAVSRGVKFTSLLNVFFAELRAQEKAPIVIGITGTKGKTTTASALAFMLEKLGKHVGIGGNIGTPPLALLGQDLDYVVLELSSFQNTSLEYYPDYCIVVSISPAHLDWHQNYENYKRDKLQILQPNVKKYLCGYDEYLRTLDLPNSKLYYKTTLPLPELKLFGEHNIVNISGALDVISDLGLDAGQALKFLAEFEPIEHRLQKVHESRGIMFIDDSIATVAESTIAGIKAFAGKPVAVIVGGFDNKSANFTELEKFATDNDDVKIIVGLPETGHWINSPKLKKVGASMQEAVDAAVAALPNGGVVLLSPAAQSFNMYKNYKERGDDFAAIARRF